PGGSPTSEPICFEDFQTDPRFTESYRKDMMSRGLRSSVVLPLRNAGAWQALIVAYWAEPHTLSEDEKVVYTAIIPTVASVVARHRAYLETQASEKAATILYQLAENINAATTHQETLEAVARLMPDCQGVYL